MYLIPLSKLNTKSLRFEILVRLELDIVQEIRHTPELFDKQKILVLEEYLLESERIRYAVITNNYSIVPAQPIQLDPPEELFVICALEIETPTAEQC